MPATWRVPVLDRFRGVRTRALMGLGVAVTLLTGSTFAYWTDQVPISGTQVSTGLVDLTVNGADAIADYAALSLTDMMPGDSVAGVLTVRNAGTVALQYYVDGAASESTLGGAIAVKVTNDSTVTGAGRQRTCSGTALAASKNVIAPAMIFSPAAPRRLEPGESMTLCVQLTLPGNAPNNLQNTSTNASFTFEGQQVVA